MKPTTNALSFSDVAFRRHGQAILEGIDWNVRPGERWVLLGPNGAGKTTLLRLASTYEVPSSGEQYVLGFRVGSVDLRELRKRIGFVSNALLELVPRATVVRDFVVMGRDAKLRRWRDEYSKQEWQRAEILLKDVGCDDLAWNRFENLSAGEKQRVQVARAMMSEPELLLLDEPTAGLDVAGREQLVETLSGLAQGPIPAIVFVTHHPEEIPPGFDHALLLRAGQITASGAIEETLRSDLISKCFDMELRLRRDSGRYRVISA